MKSPLSSPAFRTLFCAQIASLTAVGLLTVALSLAAFRIGGVAAGGQILGLLLALKMVAYVGLAPLADAVLRGRGRKRVMVLLDIGRMGLLIPMAFAATTWEIAILAFAFFALSSAFTPLFQSVIPDVLPEKETYSRALAYSRVAYTIEAVMSPVIAAALLSAIRPDSLFLVAALSFAASIIALVATRFPADVQDDKTGSLRQRALRGLSIYRRTPRLRGLFLFNLALSLAMAWVLVNSVVYAGARLGDADRYFPILMAFYGLGAALGAVFVPRLVERYDERRVMATGALAFAAVGPAILLPLAFSGLLALWAGFGLASSLVLTPGGLVLTRSANQKDRSAVFAAQFSLSHAGWLIAYPLAGWLAAAAGLEQALVILSALCAVFALIALRVWPATDPEVRPHHHPDLPEGHPHLRDVPAQGPDHRHQHAFYIDDLHPTWPRSAA